MSPRFCTRAIALCSAWLLGCSARAAPPLLLVQLSLITRSQNAEDERRQQRDVTLSASLAMPLDSEPVEGARAPPLTAATRQLPAADCEPLGDPLCAWAQRAEELEWLQSIAYAPSVLESTP